MDFEFENGWHGELQRRLRDLHPEIAADPGLANGGRILNVLDIAAVGWERIRAIIERDGVIALTAVPEDATMAKVAEVFGAGARASVWRVFLGEPETVLPCVKDIVAGYRMPQGWRLHSVAVPDDTELAAVALLNQKTGVRPTPAY